MPTTRLGQETQNQITALLGDFLYEDFFQAGINFLKGLGYSSSRTLTNENLINENLEDFFGLQSSLNVEAALVREWTKLHFLFQITDEEIGSKFQSQLGSINFRSYMFFAINLREGKEKYRKNVLERIAIEFNRIFLIPCLILFKHGQTMSLVIANRRVHKRDPHKDVIQQANSLIDIHLKYPSTKHLRLLSEFSLDNLLQQEISNFEEMHQEWEEIFETDQPEYERANNHTQPRDIVKLYFSDLRHYPILSDLEKFHYGLTANPAKIVLEEKYNLWEMGNIEKTYHTVINQILHQWQILIKLLPEINIGDLINILEFAPEIRNTEAVNQHHIHNFIIKMRESHSNEILDVIVKLLVTFYLLPKFSATRICAYLTQESFVRYKDDFNKLLPPKESLFEEYGAIEIQAKKSRNFLINSHLRLAISRAKSKVVPGVELPDLIQAGNEGLIRAATDFDISKGHQFSTYATWWVDQKISRYIGNHCRTIRLPIHMHDQVIKLKQIQNNLLQELGTEKPSALNIAIESDYISDELKEKILANDNNLEKLSDEEQVELNGAVSRVGKVLVYGRPILYLDKNVKGRETTIADLIPDVQFQNFDQRVNQQMLCFLFNNKIFTKISKREINILKLRYGLIDGERLTLEEIGEMEGVTRERIRQIEVKSLNRLRGYCIVNGIGIADWVW